MAYRGKFKPKNIKKYSGNVNNITFRSLWEYKFMKFCDENSSVLSWNSEEVVIPYISPIDGRKHRYFVDICMTVKTTTGNIETLLIEIKPKKQTIPPVQKKRITSRYLKEVETYCVNKAKWDHAIMYCEEKNWKFKILTENELFK